MSIYNNNCGCSQSINPCNSCINECSGLFLDEIRNYKVSTVDDVLLVKKCLGKKLHVGDTVTVESLGDTYEYKADAKFYKITKTLSNTPLA